MREATALGAAIAAGLSVGVWSDLNDVCDKIKIKTSVFSCKMNESGKKIDFLIFKDRSSRYSWWRKAIEKSMDFASI